MNFLRFFPNPSRAVLLRVVALAVTAVTNVGSLQAAERGAAGAAVLPVAAWLQAQTNIQSWAAGVKQIRSFKTLAQPLVETGRVWFAAPNQFRWEIGAPAKTIAVRSGGEMLVIYPKLKRAEKFPLTGQQAGPWKDTLALLEAGFPRSEAELEAQFRVESQVCTNGTCEIVLIPRSASARRMIPMLKIGFDPDDHLLRATELHFADGSYMRNEFSGGVVNPKMEPDVFRPVLGADVEVIEPLKQKGR